MAFLMILTVLVSVAILAGLACLGRIEPRVKADPGSPRKRLIRIACGLLALGLVAGMALAGIRDARSVYLPPGELDLRVPAKAPPEPSPEAGPLKQGRFLVHLVVAEGDSGVLRILRGKTVDLHWSGTPGPAARDRLSGGAGSLDYEISLREVSIDRTGKVSTKADFRIEASALGSFSTISSSCSLPAVQRSLRFEPHRSLLSLQRVATGEANVLFDLTPVREDDPLRQATAEEVLALRGRERWDGLLSEQSNLRTAGSPAGAPAFALLAHLGQGTLVLLAASLLSAYAFPRSSWGFARSLACLVLFAAALDRMTLLIHTSRLADPRGREEDRLLACSQVRSTFFFGKTARSALVAVAQAADASESLKRMAERELRLQEESSRPGASP